MSATPEQAAHVERAAALIQEARDEISQANCPSVMPILLDERRRLSDLANLVQEKIIK